MTATVVPGIHRAPESPLDRLDPISLDELIGRAALQTRYDRKYVLPATGVRGVLAELRPDTRVLDIDGRREFAYESVYFDTPELTSYLLTARRRRRRFKVRTRTYLDSAVCFLEVKTQSGRGSTVKERLPYQSGDRTHLTPGRSFVDAVLGRADLRFAPVLGTWYRRTTLYLPGTASRVTIDTDLTWSDGYTQLRLPGLAVIETKTGSTASSVDRLLWRRGFRPARISKYATGLAALRPDLPATPWRQTLRRHFIQ